MTINCIASAIGRLRAVHEDDDDANQQVDLFRGMRDLTADSAANAEFFESGGSESAPMSTTTDLHIAMRYAASQSCLLFVLRTCSFQERGADVSYLSCFPDESEILYPPMTHLRPTGKQVVEHVDGATITAVQVAPTLELGS